MRLYYGLEEQTGINKIHKIPIKKMAEELISQF